MLYVRKVVSSKDGDGDRVDVSQIALVLYTYIDVASVQSCTYSCRTRNTFDACTLCATPKRGGGGGVPSGSTILLV